MNSDSHTSLKRNSFSKINSFHDSFTAKKNNSKALTAKSNCHVVVSRFNPKTGNLFFVLSGQFSVLIVCSYNYYYKIKTVTPSKRQMLSSVTTFFEDDFVAIFLIRHSPVRHKRDSISSWNTYLYQAKVCFRKKNYPAFM